MSGMPAKVNGHAVIEPPNTCAPDTQLTVELRRNLELSAEDTAARNAMIESHPEVGVFVSRAWLSGYFADPPDGVEPSPALVRQGPTLRGAVPIAIRHASTAACVSLLGGGHGSDRVDLVVARGFETSCSRDSCTLAGRATKNDSRSTMPAPSAFTGTCSRCSFVRAGSG